MNQTIFKNLYKKIYIAKKDKIEYDDYNNEVVIYKEPSYLGKFNYQPLTNNELQAYISAYGETKKNIVRVFLDLKYKDKINEFDLAYLYGKTPENEKIYGENANYIVKTKKEQNTKVMIIFEEIIKEENNNG